MQLSITILSQTGGHGDGWEVCGAHMPGMMVGGKSFSATRCALSVRP